MRDPTIGDAALRRHERIGAALLAVILLAAAATYSRSRETAPNFDEGGYTAALDALRHGQELGSQVVVVQPPGFYLGLQWLAAVVGDDIMRLRLGLLVLALGGFVAAYFIGRRFGGPAGGVGAAALLAIAPPWPVFAPLVEADPPSVALGLMAIALASYAYDREHERPWLAALAGVALACSILVKLFTGTVFVPLIALAVKGRTSLRTLGATVGGGLSVLVLLSVTHLDTMDDFWRDSVTGQLANRDIDAPSHLDNFHRVIDYFHPRTPITYLVLAGIAVAGILAARRRRLGLWPLWSWTIACIGFTVWMRPLLDHHLVLLAASIAIPAGTALGAFVVTIRRPVVAALVAASAALFVAAGFAQQWRQISENVKPIDTRTRWAAAGLRAGTSPDGFVISDLAYAAVLADRRIAGPVIDTSWGRVRSGTLSADDVMAVVDDYGVRAVVVGRMLGESPGLRERLEQAFPYRREFDGVRLYRR